MHPTTATHSTLAATSVLNTRDINLRPHHDLSEAVARFLTIGEGVIVHWVEFTRGVLLFVMAPGDERSGEFYIYDRKKGTFWLLNLPDAVYGGYTVAEMRQKMREFRLLDLAENPARLTTLH